MSLPRTVAEVIHEHVTLELERIDRMYLNVYVPQLQRELGVVSFFRFHRDQPFASSALIAPMSNAFVKRIEAFVEESDVPLIRFRKNQRKDDVAVERFAPLLGKDPLQITPGQMTYPLRRLRLQGLIVRRPRSHRYLLTEFGLRVTLFFTRTYARLLRPGLAHVTAGPEIPNSSPSRAFNQVESTINQWIITEKLAG